MIKFSRIFYLFLSTVVLIAPTVLAHEAEPLMTDSERLRHTHVTPFLEEAVVRGKNTVYCPNFQVAWDQFSDDIVKQPVELQGNPEEVPFLNKRLIGKKDIPDSAYALVVTMTKDGGVEKVKQTLRSKFNRPIDIDARFLEDNDILIYAFFSKSIDFQNSFENLNYPILFNGSYSVKAFGIMDYAKNEDPAKQIRVVDYKSADDFLLLLSPVSFGDEIILAKVSPKPTLLETVEEVFRRLSSGRTERLDNHDTLRIPKIDFNIEHRYANLENRLIANKTLKDCSIGKVYQSIRFRMDGEGTLLQSQSLNGSALPLQQAENSENLDTSSNDSKKLIVDKPFLLCVRKQFDKYPYLALWIDNEQLLLARSGERQED